MRGWGNRSSHAFGQTGAALEHSTCVALEPRCCCSNPVRSLRRLEASAISWRIHVRKPSTHVLMPPKLGALREVAHDNNYGCVL